MLPGQWASPTLLVSDLIIQKVLRESEVDLRLDITDLPRDGSALQTCTTFHRSTHDAFCSTWSQESLAPTTILRPGMEQGSRCTPGNMNSRGGIEIGYPGDKAVSHVLRQLLVLLQLFEEDAAKGEKGCIRHLSIEDPT